ncbi:hypothetical protein DNTS_004383 [Danionella cerebrum]|uniref:Uncharacterized protein n=1 Tax=Danionella cerebrum TaxID=2873325 RepID=A0A553RDW3_9TELE|nr:hypothetical protein DNTS_004383 [Danionella translucida]
MNEKRKNRLKCINNKLFERVWDHKDERDLLNFLRVPGNCPEPYIQRDGVQAPPRGRTMGLIQKHLATYLKSTLIHTLTVKDFCDEEQNWALERKNEIEKMKVIKDKAERVILKFDHVKSAEKKNKAFREYTSSKVKQIKANSKFKKLKKRLDEVLKDTLEGLKKLGYFQDAVEKLAVTSLSVFTGKCFLLEGISLESVQSVIEAARKTSRLLIYFKTNAESFFSPSLNNLDIMLFQLEKYIRITGHVCKQMRNRCILDELPVKLNVSLSEDTTQKMIDHLKQLSNLRLDQNIRLTLIFDKHALNFIGVFAKFGPRMEHFLSDLEKRAVKLDRMTMGTRISTVAGSSAGIVSGALSIAGLALAPVTAGLSLTLTLTAVGVGVTSGVTSLVTGITGAVVKSRNKTKAKSDFQSYYNDMLHILNSLEDISCVKDLEELDAADVLGVVNVLVRTGKVSYGIYKLADSAAVAAVLRNEEGIAAAAKIGLQEAQGARTIGKLAQKTPLVLSKSARAGYIALNAFLIGIDIAVIFREGMSLAKGNKSGTSQLIRSRALLLKSELEAWKKIYDSFCIGIWKFQKSKEVLERNFLP